MISALRPIISFNLIYTLKAPSTPLTSAKKFLSISTRSMAVRSSYSPTQDTWEKDDADL